MPGTAECVVSVSPGIGIFWIQTRDGGVCLTIRRLVGSPARIEKSEEVVDGPSNIWTCSERLESDSKTISFQTRDGDAESQSNEQTDKRAAEVDEFEEKVQKLRQKIENKWAKRVKDVKQDMQLWTKYPGAFFGNTNALSSEQWSFESLYDSGKKKNVNRDPFHKVNLANHLDKRIESTKPSHPSFLVIHSKRAVLADICPGFNDMDQKDQRTQLRTYERHVEQGKVLRLISSLYPGLFLIVAPLLTRDDLTFISHNLRIPFCLTLPWVDSKKLKGSPEYNAVTLAILEFMKSRTESSLTKRKTESQLGGVPSAKRQRGFGGDHTARHRPEKNLPWVAHQSHHASRGYMSEQRRLPQTPTQCRASAPNDPRQRHLTTNHQDDRLLSSPLPTNNQAREPLSDISLNATNIHDVDQQQRIGESISDTLRLERTGIGTISAVLNHNSNTSAIAFATTQDSLQGSEDQQSDATPAGVVTSSLRVIQFEKHTLYQIVLERPTDILGGIWFGYPVGLVPSITLRLSKALGNIIKASGREVYIDRPSPEACGIVTGVFLIEIGCFKHMIQRDGFGEPFWNQCGEEAFVTMQVLDAGLIADFIKSAVPD